MKIVPPLDKGRLQVGFRERKTTHPGASRHPSEGGDSQDKPRCGHDEKRLPSLDKEGQAAAGGCCGGGAKALEDSKAERDILNHPRWA